MTETAIVLFVKHSKHVLATVTRTGDPAAAPKPEDLAGDLFPFRDDTGDILVEIAPDQLDTKVVPFGEDLIINPQLCGLAGADESSAELVAGPVPTVQLTTAGVTVTFNNPIPAKVSVWAQVDSGSGQTRDHAPLKDEIPAQGTTVTLSKTFPAGVAHDVLVLVQGSQPVMQVDKIL